MLRITLALDHFYILKWSLLEILLVIKLLSQLRYNLRVLSLLVVSFS